MKYLLKQFKYLIVISTAIFGQILLAQSQLNTSFELTGTIVQSNSALSLALITTKQSGQQMFSEGDEIDEDIILDKIETEQIWLLHNEKKYLLEINSSQASAPVSYSSAGQASTSRPTNQSKKLTKHQIDHPEFYNEQGILMEGAVGLKGNATAAAAAKAGTDKTPSQQGAFTTPSFAGKEPTQHQIEHPEFYNEKGILMEGSAGLNPDESELEPLVDGEDN